MITGDMAREQIADRVRAAESFRRSRTTRRGSEQERRSTARKVYRGFVTVIAGPFRH